MSKLSAGLIGFGYWGKNLARVVDRSERCTLSVVCDTDPAAGTRLKDEYPALKFTADARSVIGDPSLDLIVVATPVATHFELVRQCLEQGKHVLCEKLLTTDETEIAALTSLARSKGLTLFVGYTFLYNAVVRYIRRQLEADRLGSVSFLTFKRTGMGPIRSDVDVIGDLAPHDLSMLVYWMGMPVWARATTVHRIMPDRADVAFIELGYEGGTVAHIHVSWINPMKQRVIELVGEKGMMIFDDVQVAEKLRIMDTGYDYQSAIKEFGSFQLALKSGDIFIPNIAYPEPLAAEFDAFLHAASTGADPTGTNTLQMAADTGRILSAIRSSLDMGGAKAAIT